MKPTSNLRYVEREVYVGCGDFETQEFLQQYWVAELSDSIDKFPGKWIDVPTVKEND